MIILNNLSGALSQIYLSLRKKFPQFNIRHLKRASEALGLLNQIAPEKAFVEALKYGFIQIEEGEKVIDAILNHPIFQEDFPEVKREHFTVVPKAKTLSAIPENLNELIQFVANFVTTKELKEALILLSRLIAHKNKLVAISSLTLTFRLLPSSSLREIIMDELESLLEDKDWHVRQAATQALGEIFTEFIQHGRIEYLKKLENMLHHPDWHVQTTAAKTLSAVYVRLIEKGEEIYQNALENMLQDSRPEICMAAINALTDVYLKSVQKGLRPELAKFEDMIHGKDLSIRIAVITSLARIYAALVKKKKKINLRELEDISETTYGRIRESLVHALAVVYLAFLETGQKPDFSRLENLLSDEDWRVRIAAINAVSNIYIQLIHKGEIPSLNRLEALLKDRYSPVTKAAATALGRVCAQIAARGNKDCLNKLEDMLDPHNWFFSRKVSTSLSEIYAFLSKKGERQYLKRLEDMLNDNDFYVCIVAITSLASVYKKLIAEGENPALSKIETMLEHPNLYVRITAAASLTGVYASYALRGKKEYLNKLEELLESEDPNLIENSASNLVRVYAGLIKRGEKKYLKDLENLLQLKKADVAQEASQVLEEIISETITGYREALDHSLTTFESTLKQNLDAPLKGSFASEIKINQHSVKIGQFELKRNKALKVPACVFTTSCFELLKAISLAYLLNHPALLLGHTSTGKSFLIKWLATLLGYEHLSYTLNPYSSKFELIGGIKPDKEGKFIWEDGIILKAAKAGKWLVLEEINLASSDVIEILNDYLTTGKFIYSQDGQQKQLVPHANFRLFATANPESYSQRQKLSQVFLSRWKIYYQKELTEPELAEILSGLFKIPSSVALMIARFHKTLERQSQAKLIGKEEKDNYVYSLRDIIRIGKRIEPLFKNNLPDNVLLTSLFWELYTVYLARIRNKSEKEALMASLDAHFCFRGKGLKLEEILNEQEKKLNLMLDEVPVTRGKEFIPQKEAEITPTKSQKITLLHLLSALKHNDPVLLVGMPASGKTTLIRYLARKKQTNLFYINLSSDTGLEELLGGYVQNKKGKWHYQRGLLFEAVERGFWLLIDEANLNPLSEYLNTLIDFGYVIDEEGNLYKAHPHFRLFMAINPPRIHQSRTLLSPSLRSRCCEIWVEEITTKEELEQLIRGWMASDW
ncbi:MAG: AAA family ATPase [Candidatus Desulfofervidaceae bacterium]|nr:AAA family ATPase [Candidatus Desulfofervidaceae bacterium]